jgi:hypothetical protein
VPTAKDGYFLKNGERVPGVTTILGRWKESGGLIRWAYQRGKDGLELYESRDKAAELGTIVHEMAEAFINGKDPSLSIPGTLVNDDRHAVFSAFTAFQEWWESNKFVLVEQETQMVSEVYKFGGTFDLVARDFKDRLCIVDFKTSDGIYQEYLAQIAAYRLLWNENRPDMPLTGGSHLCRFSKSNADFTHHAFPDLSDAERMFILLREAYDLDKALKKRC